MSNKNLVMLVIMDGFGVRKENYGNAINNAYKPNLDFLMKEYPHTTINASGEAVGLPDGQMGNSEVGHMNIGAGRIIFQSLTRLNIAVRENTLMKMPAIDKAIKNALHHDSNLHIMGLLSDGGVHSHIDHIIYMMKRASDAGIKNIYVHPWLDGRDVPPCSAKFYLKQLEDSLEDNCHIGVVAGRYYAMDRDKNWDRIQLAYNALVFGEAEQKGLLEGIDDSYQNGITDEFIKPYIVTKDAIINDNDSVIYANFRPDRAIELSVALTNPKESQLERFKNFSNLDFVQMMLYSDLVKGDVNFPLQKLNNTLGEVISLNGLKQLRIAETEKYPHVTYFLDGGVDKSLDGEDRVLINSPKVSTYDLQPEMSAYLITDEVVNAINSLKYDTIILNFANCDMVGHTTVYDATIKAVEAVDECVGKVYQACKKVNGTLIITADHGNADMIYDLDGNPISAHTLSPVPFIVTRKDIELRNTGNLGDIAPTMLELLGIDKPDEMTGQSMIKKRFK